MAWYRSGASCGLSVAAPRRVRDPDAERLGVGDRRDGTGIEAAGGIVAEELEGHDRHARRDPDDARAVERRGDRPGHVRPVEVVAEIVDGVVVVAEVPAMDVVDVAVGVVVDAVRLAAAARFAGVRPGTRREVGMAEVDAVVDDRDDRARAAGRDPERLASVDVDVGGAAGAGRPEEQVLAGVVEAPQLVPVRLVRRVGVAIAPVVDADPQHPRVLAELRTRRGRLAGRRPEHHGALARQVDQSGRAGIGDRRSASERRHARPEGDDEAVRVVHEGAIPGRPAGPEIGRPERRIGGHGAASRRPRRPTSRAPQATGDARPARVTSRIVCRNAECGDRLDVTGTPHFWRMQAIRDITPIPLSSVPAPIDDQSGSRATGSSSTDLVGDRRDARRASLPSARSGTAPTSSSAPSGSACSRSRTSASPSTSMSSGPSSRSSCARPRSVNEKAAQALEQTLRTNFADGDGRLPRTLEKFLGDRGALRSMVDELFDESKRDSAIGRIGTMLERYFDGDASKLALLLDPTRLNSPMHQFRQEMTAGFRSLEERLVAIEAAAAARGAERARSAAKGGDFEDLLEAMLADLARGAGDLLDRTGTDAGAVMKSKKGDFVLTARRARGARLRPEGRHRGQGPPDVDAGDARRAARREGEPGRGGGGRRVHAGPCPGRGRAVQPGRRRRLLRHRPGRSPSRPRSRRRSGSPACWPSPRWSSARSRSTPRRIAAALTAIREQLEVVRS